MLRELRKIRKTNPVKMQYIFQLMREGKIKKYTNNKGYVCYDDAELRHYKDNVHLGRPPLPNYKKKKRRPKKVTPNGALNNKGTIKEQGETL